MKISFLEAESQEQEYFRAQLGEEHEVSFVGDIESVPEDTEIVSIFIHSKITPAFLESHKALRLIVTRSSGYDHIALKEVETRGIPVSHVPSYGENTVAEHSFALLLALSRRLRESLAAYARPRFSYQDLRGFDLMGKTFGIIGTGRIGLHAARIARGFQMNVLAYDIVTQPLVAATLDFEYVAFEELLARADVISLYIPLSDRTRYLLSRETLAKCKPGVVIINTARGGLVDSEALLEALESGQVAAAGLDVLEDERVLQQDSARLIGSEIVSHVQRSAAPEEPMQLRERVEELRNLVRDSKLLALPNVIFTPHAAFNSVEAVARINQQTVHAIRQFILGRPVNLVPKSTP